MTPHPESPGLGLGSDDDGLDGDPLRHPRGSRRPGHRGAPGVRHARRHPAPRSAIGEGDDRFELLLEVERIADGAGWPGEGPDQLVALIVPRARRRVHARHPSTRPASRSGWPRTYEGPGGRSSPSTWRPRARRASRSKLTVAALRSGRAAGDLDRHRTRCARSPTTTPKAHAGSTRWTSRTGSTCRCRSPTSCSAASASAFRRPRAAARRAACRSSQALAERAARGFANTQLISRAAPRRASASSASSACSPRR